MEKAFKKIKKKTAYLADKIKFSLVDKIVERKYMKHIFAQILEIHK